MFSAFLSFQGKDLSHCIPGLLLTGLLVTLPEVSGMGLSVSMDNLLDNDSLLELEPLDDSCL